MLREGGLNPVARSNVCPAIAPPSEPSFHAFVFTVPDRAAPPSFAIAGSAEAPEGKPNYHDYIIAPGDVSPTGLRTKALWVLGRNGAAHGTARRWLGRQHRGAGLYDARHPSVLR